MTYDEALIYVDASHIRDYQGLQRAWFTVGEQKKIPTYGHHAKVTLYGALNYFTGEVFMREYEKVNAETFIDFLKNLKKYLISKGYIKIYIILDNARVHHAKMLIPVKEKYQNVLEFLYLPPYSPNLNKIEELWRWLKSESVYNKFHKTVDDIRVSVRSFIENILPDTHAVLKRLCS